MVKIATILTEVLRPVGFKRTSMSWLRYRKPLLTRVSFYASQYGGPGYLDVAMTISEKPIEKQRAGDWEVADRIFTLIPSGPKIRELLKKELTDQEALFLKIVLQKEAVPLLAELADPMRVAKIIGSGNWLGGSKFVERLDGLIRESSGTDANAGH